MKGKSRRALRPAKPRLHYPSMFRFSFYRKKITKINKNEFISHYQA